MVVDGLVGVGDGEVAGDLDGVLDEDVKGELGLGEGGLSARSNLDLIGFIIVQVLMPVKYF